MSYKVNSSRFLSSWITAVTVPMLSIFVAPGTARTHWTLSPILNVMVETYGICRAGYALPPAVVYRSSQRLCVGVQPMCFLPFEQFLASFQFHFDPVTRGRLR